MLTGQKKLQPTYTAFAQINTLRGFFLFLDTSLFKPNAIRYVSYEDVSDVFIHILFIYLICTHIHMYVGELCKYVIFGQT